MRRWWRGDSFDVSCFLKCVLLFSRSASILFSRIAEIGSLTATTPVAQKGQVKHGKLRVHQSQIVKVYFAVKNLPSAYQLSSARTSNKLFYYVRNDGMRRTRSILWLRVVISLKIILHIRESVRARNRCKAKYCLRRRFRPARTLQIACYAARKNGFSPDSAAKAALKFQWLIVQLFVFSRLNIYTSTNSDDHRNCDVQFYH